MKTEPHQLAYPCDGEYAGEARSNNDAGLTKREHFAGLALQGLCASSLRDNKQGWDIEAYAIEAVALADELIKQLNEAK